MHRQNGTACGSLFFVGCIGRNKCCKRGCFVINLVKIQLNDKIENVDG